jgi:uncharacterized coiled-coil protein SlyX
MEIRVAELEATIHNTTDCLSTADDRIKELEADNASLLESVDRSLSVSVNFEGLYTTSQSRNTELECRLRQYDHQLPIAEDLVAKLETELCENNQVVDAAHARLAQLETKLSESEHHNPAAEARIKELEDENKRLGDDVELCRDVGLELERLNTIANIRSAELARPLRRGQRQSVVRFVPRLGP